MELTRSFKEFFNSGKAGGILLLGCTALSLVLANTHFGPAYSHFWHSRADLSFPGVNLNYSVEDWINDGLMTTFFLLLGLEIKRELYKGELKEKRNAVLPIAAAVGGMIVPAFIYYLVNKDTPTSAGFGIPIATDIVFVLGILSLTGNRLPGSLKIFLTSLAIIDDLGAILIVAVFYNTGIHWTYFLIAIGIFAMLVVFNKIGVKNLVFYLLPGVIMWYYMMQSGVHGSISGALLAFVVPFSLSDRNNPSYILQHALQKPVAFFILPVFVLANTGIFLPYLWYYNLSGPNSIGIVLGLLVGKPVGILLCCWMVVKLKFASLPSDVNWKMITGAGVLTGVGFTMSIFIANLAFTDAGFIQYSKVAVLIASLIATLTGLAILFTIKKSPIKKVIREEKGLNTA